MTKTAAYAAFSPGAPLGPLTIDRRALGPLDVEIDILYCGVCHSDYHYLSGEWGTVPYPVVPGHEIVGRVRSVGAEVTRFAPGDTAAVGVIVDSCRQCPSCHEGEEQYCVDGLAGATYGGIEKQTGLPTYGGYSKRIVVDEHYTLRVPHGLDPAATAPILCAGITTYSPLRHWKVGPSSKVGVVGLGGLGHMALKLAHAMGAEVTLFTTSPGKEEDARRLGADHIVISRDPGQMAAVRSSLDVIINTVSAPHDLNPIADTLRRDGTLVLVGLPPTPHAPLIVEPIINNRRGIAGSLIGSMRETQELLDFCAVKGIASDIELIAVQDIDMAYERMIKGDVKYRFVLDMATLPD